MADQSNTDVEGAAAFRTLVNSWGGVKKITLDLRTSRFLSVSLSYSVLLKEDSVFADFVLLKVCERKEIFARYKMRLLSSNLQ